MYVQVYKLHEQIDTKNIQKVNTPTLTVFMNALLEFLLAMHHFAPIKWGRQQDPGTKWQPLDSYWETVILR